LSAGNSRTIVSLAGLVQVRLGLLNAVFQRLCVGLIGVVNLRRHDHFRLQIDRVLRLVGQVRRAVFHAGDATVRVGLADPLVVADLLVLLAA
jgi:hypothetical protein